VSTQQSPRRASSQTGGVVTINFLSAPRAEQSRAHRMYDVLSCSASALDLTCWAAKGFVRAGLSLEQPRRPLGISTYQEETVWDPLSLVCGSLSVVVPGPKISTWISSADVPGDTNVGIRNIGTALSVFSCSNTSPDASAFLQGGMHACRYLMDLMQGVRTLYVVES
jgi:hypothetical protein